MLHYISYIVANVSNIVDYLCKCIQLGWCVFHLNNRYLGLLIGKIRKCSSEYMSRFNGFCYGVKTNTLMTLKNMHARSFFFKDLATPIGFIRAYMLIEFSKLQNIYIKKHWKRLFNTAIITGFNMILLFYFISVVRNDFY